MNVVGNEYLLLMHDFIKLLTINMNFKKVYTSIGKYFFRYYVRNENVNKRLVVHAIKKFMASMHNADGTYVNDATCYTIALTIQVFLYKYGMDSELRIGITKVDEKLFGHAWAVLVDDKRTCLDMIFNPGNINIDGLKVITIMQFDREVRNSVYESI